jgi:hypothetical protein
MLLRDFLEELKKISHPGLARDYLKEITRHHRVQGSRGLIEAIKVVKEVVEEYGLETKLIEIPPDTKRGFMETPVSWDVEKAFLELKRGDTVIARYNLEDHPTLVAAHSPPGEGCDVLKYCPDLEKCSGQSVLLEAPAYVAFKELDVDLVLLYDSKRHLEAVPYTGLFLTSSEVKKKPVVLNIPASTALRLISDLQRGTEVRVCWSSSSRYVERPHYALLAYEGEAPSILYISHICHPKPGAHDNASGSVANMLSAYMLSHMREIGHMHVWVPEYTGTILLREYLPVKPIGVVNLDMVGSKQWITDSTLNIVMSPLFIEHRIHAHAFLASKIVLDEAASFGGFKLPKYRYSISPYSAGSDHDVTIGWGFDSVMFNEWPSKYYHTDMDEVDAISPLSLTNMAIIASLTGVMASKFYAEGRLMDAFHGYLKSWYSIEAAKYDFDISELGKILENRLKPESMNTLKTPLIMKLIYTLYGRELYMKLREVKGAYSFFTLYGPLAHINGIQDPLKLFQLENLLMWSSEERKLIVDTWNKIREEVLK